jgi:SAM-dependent methyltransferase
MATPGFDKYWFYRNSVQSPDVDVRFFRKVYRELKGFDPEIFREDFCGTFAISCEWAKLAKTHLAFGVDLDDEPIDYGKANYLSQLKPEVQERVKVMQGNVLHKGLPEADIIAALNFSFFTFKQRNVMMQYFENCRKNLRSSGILILDCFGGSQCYDANEEETQHKTFSYYWDQSSFDPITNDAKFYIHYKPKGKRKIEKVFTYDWRFWSIPELRDILTDAGFKTTHVYWEGTTKKGEGDGKFKRRQHGEECDAWIAYIVAEA